MFPRTYLFLGKRPGAGLNSRLRGCRGNFSARNVRSSGRKGQERRPNNGAAADENAQLRVSKAGCFSACALSRLSARR